MRTGCAMESFGLLDTRVSRCFPRIVLGIGGIIVRVEISLEDVRGSIVRGGTALYGQSVAVQQRAFVSGSEL